MAEYKLTQSGVRVGNRHIPADPDNTDWGEYQKWLNEGNTPDPADVVTVPLPEDTLLILEDVERLLLQVPGMTRSKINNAKKDRGKPLP